MPDISPNFVDTSIFLFLILISVGVGWPLLTFFHELGHALPALLLTRRKVTIYLGSFKDNNNSRLVKIGLLEIWMKNNFFTWWTGRCLLSETVTSKTGRFIFIVSGPILSFSIAVLLFSLGLKLDFHGTIKVALCFVALLGLFDLIINLLPNNFPIFLPDGSITYNDGQLLRSIFSNDSLEKEIDLANALYLNSSFKEAAILFENILNQTEQNDVFQITVSAFLNSSQFKDVLRVHDQYKEKFDLNSNDYASAGLAKSRLEMYESSISDYNKAIELEPENTFPLSNRAFTFLMLEKYEEAKEDFDKVILIEPQKAYPYSNRGLAKIKIGQFEDGLKDISFALQLDKNDSYAYRSLGIYHLEKKESDLALGNFQKAKELDPETVEIEELIKKAAQAI